MKNGGSTHARFRKIFLNIFNDNNYKEVELYSFLCSCDHHYREMFFGCWKKSPTKEGIRPKCYKKFSMK
jgi:hypothetical protein